MHQTPRVFISYSHDSDEHREWVARLSERLRSDGIATNLDAYVNGTPAEGWPRWMLDQLDEADRVLLICTETYYRRFRGHEAPGRGRGVDWEGAVISQEIYDARSKTTRFIPVLRTLEDERYIPEPVRGQSRYCLTDEQPYQDLYKALLGRAGYEPGPVGEPKPQKRPRVKPLTFGSAYGKDQGEDRSESLSSGRSKPDAPLDQTRTSADQSPVADSQAFAGDRNPKQGPPEGSGSSGGLSFLRWVMAPATTLVIAALVIAALVVLWMHFTGAPSVAFPEMVTIPAGSFRMGCLTRGFCQRDDRPNHRVTFAKPFAIGKYEVTFAEYDRFAEATGVNKPNDEGWGRGSRPVINVSWEDARKYASWLSGETGKSYRLPTEAEWEYATRAGTETPWSFGDKASDLGKYAWYTDNSNRQTQPVGQKLSNPYGLHDLHGNASEWTGDC